MALSYFSLGSGTDEASKRYLKDYYRFLGDMAEQIADGPPRTSEALRDTVRGFEERGLDELVFDPTVADLEQIDLLAKAVL